MLRALAHRQYDATELIVGSVSGGRMRSATVGHSADQIEETIVHAALKAFSYVVLVLMVAGIVYATYIAIKYWTGISV